MNTTECSICMDILPGNKKRCSNLSVRGVPYRTHWIEIFIVLLYITVVISCVYF